MADTAQPWLSDAEIDEMCAPLVNRAAQVRFLRSLGLTVHRRPHNGSILLLRAHRDAVLSGQAAAAQPAAAQAPAAECRQPDRAALLAAFGPKLQRVA